MPSTLGTKTCSAPGFSRPRTCRPPPIITFIPAMRTSQCVPPCDPVERVSSSASKTSLTKSISRSASWTMRYGVTSSVRAVVVVVAISSLRGVGSLTRGEGEKLRQRGYLRDRGHGALDLALALLDLLHPADHVLDQRPGDVRGLVA